MNISLCDLRPLTKTLPLPTKAPDHLHTSPTSTSAVRQNRSAGSSPRRPVCKPSRCANAASDERALLAATADELEEAAIDDDDDDEAASLVGESMIAPVVDATLLPPLYARAAAAAAPPPPQPRYMSYAETRARLRERRQASNASASEVPLIAAVAAAPVAMAPAQQQAEFTGRQRPNGRARRSALRYFRRAAEHRREQLQQATAAAPPPPPPPQQQHLQPQQPTTQRAAASQAAPRSTPPESQQSPTIATADDDDELLREERRLYATVITEFRGLVVRMRDLVGELEATESQIDGAPSRARRETRSVSSPAIATAVQAATAPPHSARGWQHRVDSLNFIDAEEADDEQPPAANGEQMATIGAHDRRPLLSAEITADKRDSVATTTKKSPTSAAEKSTIERLATLVADFRTSRRPKSDETRSALLGDLAGQPDVEEMRSQLRRIARQLAQIEDALRPSDLCAELRQRVVRLKTTLGESPSTSGASQQPALARTQIFLAAANNNNADELALDDAAAALLEVQSERTASPIGDSSSIYGTIRMSNKVNKPSFLVISNLHYANFRRRIGTKRDRRVFFRLSTSVACCKLSNCNLAHFKFYFHIEFQTSFSLQYFCNLQLETRSATRSLLQVYQVCLRF